MKYLNKILRAKVVQGYEQGKTDEEIADSLKISRKTVVEPLPDPGGQTITEAPYSSIIRSHALR